MLNLKSLSQRLYFALTSTLIVFSLMIFLVSSLVLEEKTERLYDNMLLAVAKNINDKLYVKKGKLKIEMDYFSVDTLSDVRNEKIFYRIVDPSNELLAGFEGLSLVDRDDNLPYKFYDTTYAGTELRAVQYQASTKIGVATVVVAESKQGRNSTLLGLKKSIIYVAIIICFFSAILMVSIVKRSLRPLKELQKEIRLRSELNLSPIESSVPPEVEALVTSLNSFMFRLHASFETSHNFNTDLSHQLRTPLAEMKLQLSFYQKSANAGLLADIENNLTLMTRMTQQMLHYAKAQNSVVTEEYWRNEELVELCRQFCLNHAPMVYSLGQSLAFETNIEKVICRVDAVMLESALLNLIENATKYGKPLRNNMEGEIILSVVATGHNVAVSVSDQGPGVEASVVENLTQRHLRIDQSKQGSGLGLSIVQQIAYNHGANLIIRSTTPSGLCVSITELTIVE